MSPTQRLYWSHDHCLKAEAQIVAVRERSLAFTQTCFYPGGGGQPADTGNIVIGDLTLNVTGVAADNDGVLWHELAVEASPQWVGQHATLEVDGERRAALSRYHTVLHVVNTIALRDYGAWITGAQIATTYARIDFKWDGFSPALTAGLESKVNEVLRSNHPIRAYSLPEAEFEQRPDLLRTLEVRPPVMDGRVRVVAIEGFDAQACGGTHVAGTEDLGVFTITKTENKGRINKRLYVHLQPRP